MKVNEIFYSIQGEGYFTGTPAVFLRLSGCNLKCSFCDTLHSNHTDMSIDLIVEHVKTFPARHIVITGGEPTMQLVPELLQKLRNAGFFIQIETNGSLPIPDRCNPDWITCSPKGAPIQLQRIDELKVLYHGQEQVGYNDIIAREYRLQPLDTGNADKNKEILQQTLDYLLKNPKWKLSLQIHKILNVR